MSAKPTGLLVHREDEASWRALFPLVEGDGMTNLTFGQRLRSPSEVATMGPGWDFYLDRLVASRAGLPLPEWEHYYPAHAQFYKDLIVPVRTA